MAQSVYDYLAARVEAGKEKLIYFNRRFNGAQLLAQIERAAGMLYTLGVRKGDCVGVALPNQPEGIFLFYGAALLGASIDFMHPKTPPTLMANRLSLVRAKILFLYDGVAKTHCSPLEKAGIEVVLCSLGTFASKPFGALFSLRKRRGARYYDQIAPLPFERGEEPNGVAAYLHSGGTSGEAKTVAISSDNLNALAEALYESMWKEDRTEEDAMIMMLPFFHAFGLGVPLHMVLSHAKTVVIPLFRASSVVRLLKKEKITHLAGIPAMYRKLVACRSFRGKGLGSLRYAFAGGDQLFEQTRTLFDERVKEGGGSAQLLQGYGLSEAAGVVTVRRAGDGASDSVGLPLAGVSVRIANEAGEFLGAGEQGEILVGGRTVALGYAEREGEEETFIQRKGERYCRTGDIGYLSESGALYFVERKKRTLKISGVNVFPSEIERAAMEIDGVRDCCAARKKDEKGKPYVELFVVNMPGLSDPETVREALKGKLHRYSVPKKITFVPELLRTPLAKADYRAYEKE